MENTNKTENYREIIVRYKNKSAAHALRWLKRNNPEIMDFLNKMYPDISSMNEKAYLFVNKINSQPCCSICKITKTTFDGFYRGYKSTCSRSCAREKAKQTNLKRYGVKNPMQSERIREKLEKTNLERYGVKNPMQTKEVQERQKQTMLERHGAEYSGLSEKLLKKQKQTMMKRYGVSSNFQMEVVKEKIKQTNLKRYGVKNPMQSKEVQEKQKQTNLKRYGVKNPMQTKEVQERQKQTNLKKRGVEYPMQSEDVRKKHKQGCFAKYGVENPLQHKSIREKAKQTMVERHGIEYTFQSPEMVKKAKETCHKKYNTDSFSKTEEFIKKSIETSRERYNADYHSQTHYSEDLLTLLNNKKLLEKELNETGVQDFCKKYPISLSHFYKIIKKRKIIYTYREFTTEKKVRLILQELKIPFKQNDRQQIKPLELDFFLPEHNLAIEVCGLYWHSSEKKNSQYHQNKYNLCKEKGIILITLFEDELAFFHESIEKLFKLLVFNKIPKDLNTEIEIENEIKKYLDNPKEITLNNRFGLSGILKSKYQFKQKIKPKLLLRETFKIWDCGYERWTY